MPKLSVVIITLNEEKNIGRCLNRVQPIADDLVVVDSFSTDNTRVICEEYQARFIQHPFSDYVKQHTFADSQAIYDHILCIDADEVLSDELIHSIQIAKKYWKCDGYFMNRLTNYCGKWIHHSGWYPDKKLRLYDRRKGKWIGEKLHERFVLTTGSTSGHLKGDLYHYSYYSIEGHVLQANRFSTMAAEAIIEKGEKIPSYYLYMKPAAKFFRNYFLKFGFLDGIYGYIICKITAHETFLKYLKAYHKQNNSIF